MRQLKITKQITNRDSESLNKYLSEISKLKGPLSAEEEVALAHRIQLGDQEAEHELILRNTRFVVSVAKQYQNYNVPLGDLINEGNLGLIKAAKKFDGTKGNKFISYAVWWIRQTVLQSLNENGRVIRLPLNKITQLNKIKKAQAILEQDLGRKPSVDEVVSELNFEISRDDVKNILIAEKSIKPLDAGTPNNNDSEDFRLQDVLIDPNQSPADQGINKSDKTIQINRMLSKIPNRNQLVIIHYFGLRGESEKTLDEIAQMIGLTRERVRQLKNSSLTSLARFSRKLNLI